MSAMMDRLLGTGLRLSPILVPAVLLLPVVAGFAGILLPAFGWFPAVGETDFGFQPFLDMWTAPGFDQAAILSIWTSLIATLVSLILASMAVAVMQVWPRLSWLERQLSPLLSVPHATMAVGVAFLIAPSGWLIRLISPWMTGFDRPPDWLILQDPAGLSMILILILKEMPFLMLMMLAVLPQVDAATRMKLAQSLGYQPLTAWYKVIWPAIYHRMRLPVFITLGFSLSVVDVALIAGPVTPPPLAVLVLQWFHDADLSLRLQAAAGAVTLTLMAAGLILIWVIGERLMSRLFRYQVTSGHRGGFSEKLMGAGGVSLTLLTVIISWGGLLTLAIWSVAHRWRFPDGLPGEFSLRSWSRAMEKVQEPALNTLIVACAAVVIGLVLSVLLLEREKRKHGRIRQRAGFFLLVPLLVPQISFLFGFQIFLARMDLSGGWFAVIWAHLVFVLPYMFLSLADAWGLFDDRYHHVAASLGASEWRILWRIKMPILLKPVLTAMAVGIAVSVAAYLPTLIAGTGRIESLTTEVVSLANSGNRRLSGVYGLIQMAIPVIAFSLIPIIMLAKRRKL